MAKGKNDSVAIRKLSTRIQSLQDSYKRMSIWPLLEAGEFGTITDGGLSQEDVAIAKGGYLSLIDKAVQKIPEGARDVARYGMITRDTALFKAMSRAAQYGDFLAKAVLYDDLMRRRSLTRRKLWAKSTRRSSTTTASLAGFGLIPKAWAERGSCTTSCGR